MCTLPTAVASRKVTETQPFIVFPKGKTSVGSIHSKIFYQNTWNKEYKIQYLKKNYIYWKSFQCVLIILLKKKLFSNSLLKLNNKFETSCIQAMHLCECCVRFNSGCDTYKLMQNYIIFYYYCIIFLLLILYCVLFYFNIICFLDLLWYL